MSPKKLKSESSVISFGKMKLKESGLDLSDAKKLKIEILTDLKTKNLHTTFKKSISLKINYLDHKGKPLSDWPKSKPFYRLRYLGSQTDFTALTTKQIRYTQLPNTAPVAYYPANQDWSDIIKNTDLPIIITEGELKSAKACKEGFPTIGLGGVYNWRSKKLGLMWLPSLEVVNWIKRNVYICFDSDYRTNPLVCNALYSLAKELHSRGSFCHLVSLPELPELDKVGLDDFLVNAGPSANKMFIQLLSNAEPLGLTAPLWKLNSNYVYIRNPGLVIDQTTLFKTTPSAFKEHLQAPLSYQEKRLKPDGSISYKPVSAAASWLKWPLRNEVTKLTYKPGSEKFIQGPYPQFNTWPGWGVEPVKGNVNLFLKLINNIFEGAEIEAKEWFLKWCAYPIQHPGTKLFSSAVIHGIKHGTGKSLIGYTLGKIYGENFTEISQKDIHKNSNAWAENRQLVMGDDITGSNKRDDADYLKKIITQLEVWIDIKFLPLYKVPDCINYIFTANQPDAFFLEDGDRRFFIHEVLAPPLSEEFYIEYDKWYKTIGPPAIHYYLKNLDIKGFNPAAPAFKTQAKLRMISNVRSDLAGWVRQLQETPDQVLKVGEIKVNKDLFTSKELLMFYDPSRNTKTTANGLGRELARAGFRQVLEGRPVKLSGGYQARYYVIRNTVKWLRETKSAVIADHIEKYNKKIKKY